MPDMSTCMPGSTTGNVASPAARYRVRPKSAGTCTRGPSTTARPAATSRSGPSSGATTTTRAPRRIPVAAAATSAGSAGSSPATTSTSSAPIHGGASDATTNGAAIEPPERRREHGPGHLGRASGGHPDHRAGRVIRPQLVEHALIERRRGGAHLRTGHRRPLATALRGRRRANPRHRRGRRRRAENGSRQFTSQARCAKRSGQRRVRRSRRPRRCCAPRRSAATTARCWTSAG